MDETPAGERRSASAAILVEGETCWRLVKAKRASVLIDGAAYFGAVRHAMLQAKKSIVIVGWDIDGRTRLVGDEARAHDGAPETLREFLTFLVKRRKDLQVHLLLWDFFPVFSLEREVAPSINLGWLTPDRVKLHLDRALPIEASQHEKIVIIDDCLAFVGGLDLTIRRWDRSAHEVDDSDRVDPAGEPYGPFHDLQMMVDGEAASALAELARERWRAAGAGEIPACSGETPPWPGWIEPDFVSATVAISRTRPRTDWGEEVSEVKNLYLRSIERARQVIYVENQYLTADCVADAMLRALERNPRLEAVVVSPSVPHGWLEKKLMSAARTRFIQRVVCGAHRDRVRFISPRVPKNGNKDSEPILIHSKAMIIDDRLLRVGSSNLSNRSMGLDSECDLTIEARSDKERRTVARIRDRLLAEHLGVTLEQVEQRAKIRRSLVGAIDDLSHEKRIEICNDLAPPQADPLEPLNAIVDAEKPVVYEEFIQARASKAEEQRPPLLTLILPALLMVAVMAGLALAWRYTEFGQSLSLERLEELIDTFVNGVWGLPVIVAAYVALGLLIFPVILLIAATAAVFGPWLGFLYAFAGTLASAVVVYSLGALLGKRMIRRLRRTAVGRISRAMGRHGILTVVGLRIAPVAPFSVVNFVAGASHIPFRDFVIGTAVGMAPGILIMATLGSSIADLLRHPNWTGVGIVAGVIAAGAAVTFGIQKMISRRRAAEGS
jgi:phospholipase D1/2